MKHLFYFLAVIAGGLMSCSKQAGKELIISPVSLDIIEATIPANHNYILNLNSESGTIVKQALHYQVSRTELDETSGTVIYKYTPLLDYTGMDEIVISKSQMTNTGNSGCPNNHNDNSSNRTSTIYTTIHLTIAK